MSQSFTSLSFSQDMLNFIEDNWTRVNILNGIWALNETNMWGWLRKYQPYNGFMLSNSRELNIICQMMDSLKAPVIVSHSGGSFAVTMRHLKYIAENGLDAYRTIYANDEDIWN
jgi:hypothetical protein